MEFIKSRTYLQWIALFFVAIPSAISLFVLGQIAAEENIVIVYFGGIIGALIALYFVIKALRW